MSADRIFGLVRRVMRITTNTDTPNVQVQLESAADDVHNDVEVLETYGFTAHPPTSVPEGLAVFPNGESDHGIVIGWFDKAHRPTGLKAGETQQYSVHGQNQLFDEDGQITLEATQHGQRLFFNKDGEVEIRAQQGQTVLLDKTGQVVITDKAGSTFRMLANGDVDVTPASTQFRVNGYLTASYGGSSIGMNPNGDIVMQPASGVVQVIGNAKATEDMVADSDGTAISALHHRHPGGSIGAGTSLEPI
jgi:phage gp45-like